MKVVMNVENPFKINMRLEITMSIEEWNQLKDQLKGYAHMSPAWDMIKAIENLTKQATNQFVHNNEETSKAD